MKKLIFLGTNGVLERQIEACERQGQEIAGIIDSDWYGNLDSFKGLPILDSEEIFVTDPIKYQDYVFFIGTNWSPEAGRDTEKRQKFINLIKEHNLPCVNLIDPTSYVSKHAILGKGIFIGAQVSIEPNTIIEDFAQLWGANAIGHDSRVGENSVIQRQAGFHARIGKNSYVGVAALLYRNDGVEIGDNVVISPCVNVVRDIKDGEKVQLSKEVLKIYRRYNLSN